MRGVMTAKYRRYLTDLRGKGWRQCLDGLPLHPGLPHKRGQQRWQRPSSRDCPDATVYIRAHAPSPTGTQLPTLKPRRLRPHPCPAAPPPVSPGSMKQRPMPPPLPRLCPSVTPEAAAATSVRRRCGVSPLSLALPSPTPSPAASLTAPAAVALVAATAGILTFLPPFPYGFSSHPSCDSYLSSTSIGMTSSRVL